MKDCKKIHPLLALYMDEQLSPAEKTKVEKHLALCAEARQELEQFGGLIKSLHQMPGPSVPSDLHDKIMTKLGGKASSIPHHRGFWGPPAWALSAAAVLLFVLLNQYPHWNDISRVEQKRQIPAVTLQSNNGKTLTATNGSPAQLYYNVSNTPSVVNQFGYLAQQRVSSNAKANVNFGAHLDEQKDKKLGLIKEQSVDGYAGEGASANQPAPETGKNGNFEVMADIEKPAASKVMRAKKKTEAPATTALGLAYAPAAPLAEPPPTVDPLDKSLKSLTYSREESVTTWKGNNGPATVESQELVTDAETFQKYWNIPHPGETPPEVDFTKEAVVVLMAGGKPTAGYSIYVSRLEEKTDQLVIHYKVDSPATDAVTAQILTNPWALQIIPKPTKQVVFLKDP